MQVSQTNEFITHAVISGAAQIDMGISNSAEFFQILSSTLYSDQMLAVVRETTCNAWDAHVDSGRTDKPIQITVDSSKIVIRDFGHGILHELMGPIYGIYGASTKKNDGMQTGGFGLGCKAPFAYAEHFQVISNHAGTKTIYSMSKSSAQVGGKPAIIPITSLPTEETGLEVSINIKHDDMPRFLELFRLIVRNGEMNAEINGEQAATTPYSAAKNGFVIASRNPIQVNKSGSVIYVRYGNVIYPLENHADLIDYNSIINIIKRLPKRNYYEKIGNTLILLAPPHSISVTPSRETLSMQQHTINTVNELMKKFINYMSQKDEQLEHIIIKENIAKALPRELLDFSAKLNKHSFDTEAWKANTLLITNYEMYRRAVHACTFPYEINKKEALLRIKAASTLKLLVRGKAHSLYREIQQTNESELTKQTTWVTRHVVQPLLRKMKLNPNMNPSRLFFTTPNACVPVSTQKEPIFSSKWHTAANYARPYVIIHYVRKGIEHRIEKEGTLQGTDKINVLFYHVPRVVDKVQNTIDFFTAEGYQVIDLTKPLAGETTQSIAPVLRVTQSTRQQGLIVLSSAVKHGVFNAEKLYSDDTKRISKAECVFICTSTDGQRKSNYLGSFGEVSNIIMNLYGDVAGVAKTQDQFCRYLDKGIVNGTTYVIKDVITYITESDIILQYLTAKTTVVKHSFLGGIYDYLFRSEIACKMFNLPFISDPKDKNYLRLWDYLKRHQRAATVNAVADIDSLPEHQATLDICKKIANSKYFVFLDRNLCIPQAQFDEHIIDFANFINQ